VMTEKEKAYPEPTMFGTTPAYGFFLRHVRGLEMQSVKIECANADARPAFALADVEDATFGRMRVPVRAGGPTFVLNRVKDFSVFRSRPVKDTEIESTEKAEV